MTTRSSVYDQPTSFGWISIALHWITAAAVIALWFIGKSLSSLEPEEADERRMLHVSVGLIAWLPLLARIVWRFMQPHPKAVGQTTRIHRVARVVHYLMIAALSIMIVSGPIMAWHLPERTGLMEIALWLHERTANLLFVLVILHILGALKHLMFHEDETIIRMLWPRTKTARSERSRP